MRCTNEGWKIKVIPLPTGNNGKTMGGWKESMEEKEAGTNYLQKNLSLCFWVDRAPPIPPFRAKPPSANLDHSVDKVIPITLTKRHVPGPDGCSGYPAPDRVSVLFSDH